MRIDILIGISDLVEVKRSHPLRELSSTTTTNKFKRLTGGYNFALQGIERYPDLAMPPLGFSAKLAGDFGNLATLCLVPVL